MMGVEHKMWSFLIWSSFFLFFLGFPKLAFLYFIFNELYWETDEEDEEDEIEREENRYEEDYAELNFQDIPLFFVPNLKYNQKLPLFVFYFNSCFVRLRKRTGYISLKALLLDDTFIDESLFEDYLLLLEKENI